MNDTPNPQPVSDETTRIKQTLSVSVSIADAFLEGGIELAAQKELQARLKAAGVADGTPVEVEVITRKYDFEVRGTW